MFSDRLKALRKEMGLTQTEFAEKFHISNGAIGMWESGQRMPDVHTIQEIADFFHVSIDYLLGRDDNVLPKEICDIIAQQMLRCSAEMGDSPEDILFTIGIHSNTVHEMLAGSYPFTINTLNQVAQCFKKPLLYFLPHDSVDMDISMDDFTYAMQNEAKELTEMDKQILLSMARQLNDARRKENGETD